MCNKTEVAVGLSVSLSGKFRLQGQQALQGARLWQSYINAQGGIVVQNGKKRSVRLIWYDDRSQTSFARKNVLQLLRDDQIDILLGPYSSGLTMAVVEIAEEYKKVLWNYGGSSDEIFRHGRRYLVGIASPASDYLRALPHCLAEEFPGFDRICVLYSGRGTFGWHVARGILESALVVARHSVQLVPVNVPWENHDTILVSCSASLRRLLSWWGAFKTSWASCEHVIVGPARYVRWRRLLRASVIFPLNLGI